MVAPPTTTTSTPQPSQASTQQYVHLPVSLLPAGFPKQAFEDVVEASPIFNILVDRISRDGAYLDNALGEVVKSDEFTARLLELYKKCPPTRDHPQPLAMGIHRSDYMIDGGGGNGSGNEKQKKKLLQVELNTIASSFGCLGSRTASMQTYLLERFFKPSLSLGSSDGGGDAKGKELDAFLARYLQEQGWLALTEGGDAAAVASAALAAMPPNPNLETLPGR